MGMVPQISAYKKPNGIQVDCGTTPQPMIPCEPLVDVCLFDIVNDPCEQRNLASQRPDVVQELLDLLNWYNSTAVTPLNTRLDPLSNPKYWNYTYTNWVDLLQV